jgi:tRNA 2-thiouridine synthesizing protein A
MLEVDARGFSCPEPLIRTRNALNKLSAGDTLEILVETVTSRENVRRFLLSKGLSPEITEIDAGFKIIVKNND